MQLTADDLLASEYQHARQLTEAGLAASCATSIKPFSTNDGSASFLEWLASDTKKRRKLKGYGRIARVEGHAPYYFGSLEQWYCPDAIDRMIHGVESSLYGKNTHSARKAFDAWHKIMIAGAYFASRGQNEARFFATFNNGLNATVAEIDDALRFFFIRISDPEDYSIVTSSNDATRSGFWGGVRSVCKLFAEVGVFPHFTFPSTIWRSPRTRTPVLADLARKAGRFNDPASPEEHELAVLNKNVELLSVLRRLLEGVFLSALNDFRWVKSIISDTNLPSVETIDQHISECGLHFSAMFKARDSQYRKSCAIKIVWAMCYEEYIPTCSSERLKQFLLYSGTATRLHRLLGATPDVLNVAFHIIAIDTGWNCQPLEDLQENPFVGTTSQGRKRIRSLGGIKVRAGDKEIEGPLEDVVATWLPVRRSDVRLAGVQVIEGWLEMTAPLRDLARRMGDEAGASRLWLWRESRTNKPNANLNQLKTLWWPDFLLSIESDETVGGLQITRRIIRKTVANIEAMRGSFSHQMPMAVLDHSLHNQSKMYLTDETINALYDKKIREYLDLWEAVAVTNLDDAARRIGIQPAELHRRQQLGLASGLDFALVVDRGFTEPLVAARPETLAEDATSFVADMESMENLHIARRALEGMRADICDANPSRWARTWLPWHAIVEAIATQLESSRHRTLFRSAATAAEQKLREGTKALPVVW